MGLIDVAVPAVIGFMFLLMPVKATGDAEKDVKKKRTLRICGLGLLAVAVGYFCIKLAQGA